MDKATQVTGVEHWTQKQTPDGDVRLFLWEKYVDSPEGKPAVLFVHGSSMASQPTFDLAVPDRPDSSAMDWFAQRGFVCWTVDMEGYGRSGKERDIYCDIADGAYDLAAATEYIIHARGIRAYRIIRCVDATSNRPPTAGFPAAPAPPWRCAAPCPETPSPIADRPGPCSCSPAHGPPENR